MGWRVTVTWANCESSLIGVAAQGKLTDSGSIGWLTEFSAAKGRTEAQFSRSASTYDSDSKKSRIPVVFLSCRMKNVTKPGIIWT